MSSVMSASYTVHSPQLPVGLIGSTSRRMQITFPRSVTERPKETLSTERAGSSSHFWLGPIRTSMATVGRHVVFRKVTVAACAGATAANKLAAINILAVMKLLGNRHTWL